MSFNKEKLRTWLSRFIWASIAGLSISYYFINGFAVNYSYSISHYDFGPIIERKSLYGTTPEDYYNIIFEARKRFKIKPLVNDPCFIVVYGVGAINAAYDPVYKCILLNEGMILKVSMDELTGTIAHEYAHAEESEKIENFGRDFRPHWMVDVRAAEIAGKSGITTLVERFKSINDKCLNYLDSRPYLFFLARKRMSTCADNDREIKERLAHLRALPD